jgi:hypothetical protein
MVVHGLRSVEGNERTLLAEGEARERKSLAS